MCPELYRATFCGAADEMIHLLSETVPDKHDGEPCSREEVSAGRNTVLHIAAGQGHVDLVRRLFEHEGAAQLLRRRNSKSETALHLAARGGHHETVTDLITRIRDHKVLQVLLQKNNKGDTALHVAARHGRQPVVETLMEEYPALSCVVNRAGESPLYLAVISRSVVAVEALLRCPTASPSGPNRQNALHAAVLQSADSQNLTPFLTESPVRGWFSSWVIHCLDNT
nr:uncharacterized protein LOC127329724 [Lolium perenne]